MVSLLAREPMSFVCVLARSPGNQMRVLIKT